MLVYFLYFDSYANIGHVKIWVRAMPTQGDTNGGSVSRNHNGGSPLKGTPQWRIAFHWDPIVDRPSKDPQWRITIQGGPNGGSPDKETPMKGRPQGDPMKDCHSKGLNARSPSRWPPPMEDSSQGDPQRTFATQSDPDGGSSLTGT